MSTKFLEGQMLVTMECYKCAVLFAMPVELDSRCRRDRNQVFYCPNGHGQVYAGKTEEQKLKEALEAKTREAEQAQGQLRGVSRSYMRMRKRVANGVCPCCNRTFMNLMQHMATQHPDFGRPDQLRLLRRTFGLSQSALASEIGVNQAQVSAYERGQIVTGWTMQSIESWIATHAA